MPPSPLTLQIDPRWERLTTRDRDVLGTFARLRALLSAQAGSDVAGLLAEPELDDAGAPIAWRSPFGGDLVPAGPDAAAARDAAADRIGAVADRLAGQGAAGELAAHSLRSALVTPEGTDSLYMDSQTGQPVLVNWGMAIPGQARPVLPGAPAAGAATTEPGTADGIGSPGPESTQPEHAGANQRGARFWPWLLPAGLAAALAWLVVLAAEPVPVKTVEVTPSAPPAEDPTTGLSPQLSALDAALGEARAAEPRFAEVCVAPPEPPPTPNKLAQRVAPAEATAPPEPPVQPSPPANDPAPERTDPPQTAEVPAPALPERTPPESEPAPDAVAETPAEPEPVYQAPETAPVPKAKGRPPRIARAPQVERLAQPAEEAPRIAERPRATPEPARPAPRSSGRAACNPTWPPGRAPRMVFVVDGSGSMRDPIRGAPSRMEAAKRSIGGVVRGLHRDIRVGMVSFSDCNATRNSRYYASGERRQLIGRVNGIQPGRATSLATSITRAGAMASRRAETVIVVVSDGRDTCGRDPCAAARAVKQRKPNVRINVIDLSGGEARGVLNCVARAGGGRVYSPSSSGQMAAQVQRATGQPNASGC